MVNKKESKKRLFSGKVVSDSMDKTVVVSFERSYQHPLLGKVVRSSKKYKIHDENNAVFAQSTSSNKIILSLNSHSSLLSHV